MERQKKGKEICMPGVKMFLKVQANPTVVHLTLVIKKIRIRLEIKKD